MLAGENAKLPLVMSHRHFHAFVFWSYSADLNYTDKMNKTWIFKHVFLNLGQD